MTSVAKQRLIWIVDDSPLDAESARQILSAHHTVQVFADGSAALEALSSEVRPDVLVLDWIMPGIAGIEVCRFLRAGLACAQDISILLLTSYRNSEHIVEGLNAGANDYLAKPYAPAELLARVSALLRSADLRERAERAEEENRRLLDHTPDPLIIIEADRKLCFVNEMAVRVFDVASDYLLGLHLQELLPALDVTSASDSSSGRHPDVEIGGRQFSPSWRTIPDDGRIAILLHDVTHRRVLDARHLDSLSGHPQAADRDSQHS